MARRILLSLLIPLSAGAAWYLRREQLSLSYAGSFSAPNRWGLVLWGLLGIVALLTLLLSLPEKRNRPFTDYHAVPFGAVLQGAGALLLTAGGAWQLYQLYPALQSLQSVAAAAMLLGGLGLFGGMIAFLGSKRSAAGFLLLPMCSAGLYLVLTYLEISADPVLLHFDMRMLAIGAASLSLVCLCSLIFSANGKLCFFLFSALAVPLSVSALCTAETFPQALGLMGNTLAAFGFFLSVLFGIPARKKQNYELVNDPFRTGSVGRDEIRQAETKHRAAKASTPIVNPAPAEHAVSQSAPAEGYAVESAPAENMPKDDSAPTKETAPAAAPSKHPEKEDDFDLSRVDRLLQELGVEENND